MAVESGKASRTRRDVVEAAVECWSRDNAMSLGAVAAAAGVGRTTVHRYFADRAALVTAVDQECRARYSAAARRARLEEGTGLAALQRLCTEVMQLGPVLGLIFADNALVDPGAWYTEDADPLGIVLTRAYQDGSVATDLPPTWAGTLTWTSLFAGWLVVRSQELTWHEAARLLTRTLDAALTSRSVERSTRRDP